MYFFYISECLIIAAKIDYVMLLVLIPWARSELTLKKSLVCLASTTEGIFSGVFRFSILHVEFNPPSYLWLNFKSDVI